MVAASSLVVGVNQMSFSAPEPHEFHLLPQSLCHLASVLIRKNNDNETGSLRKTGRCKTFCREYRGDGQYAAHRTHNLSDAITVYPHTYTYRSRTPHPDTPILPHLTKRILVGK